MSLYGYEVLLTIYFIHLSENEANFTDFFTALISPFIDTGCELIDIITAQKKQQKKHMRGEIFKTLCNSVSEFPCVVLKHVKYIYSRNDSPISFSIFPPTHTHTHTHFTLICALDATSDCGYTSIIHNCSTSACVNR